MADTIHLNRVLKRLNDRFLADDVLKNLGPELSSDDLIFHESCEQAEVPDRLRGLLCHIGLPDTVASFRTWRGFRAPIAQPPKACRLSGEPLKAERVGFEPTVELPPHTLSKRAP